MWFVYILLCSDNSLYTGISDDVEGRFKDHLAGKGAKYTKSHKPLKILHLEGHSNKSQALKREIEIKSWSRTEKIKNFGLENSIIPH